MGIPFSEIDDAVLLTQNTLIKRGAFTDLQTDLTDHVAVREMWQNRSKTFIGGENWEWEAQVDHNHSARAVDLFETDGSAITDTMIQGTVAPKHLNAHYIYDQREKAFQRGGTAIVDLIKTRYVGMMVSWFEFLEELLWSETDDTTKPQGIPYWVQKDTSEGFHGTDPASGARGGISSATYSRWANYTGEYSDVSKTDLIRKMRSMHRRIRFRSPVSHAQPTLGKMRNGIYVNDTVIGLMEEVLEENNMNLGNDLASKDGKTVFKSTPITYAPYLNNDDENPVYMLDWKWLKVGVMAGWYKNLSAPYMVPNKHLVRRVDLDGSLNTVCTDLRRQGVLHNPA